MSAVLALEGVSKTYPGGVRALDDVSLRVEAGELAAVVGPSGSGKSTLLHIMGTLERPSSGRVRLDGHDVATLGDRALAALRARRIGFVFQQFFLLDGVTALENVAHGLLYTATPVRQRLAAARIALERVGIGRRAMHLPNQLSGGERQRVAIARALVARPAIVFADEPTGNLDSRSGAAVVELLRTLNDAGTTIVVITHDQQLAHQLPRRMTMHDGRLVGDA
ncbi:ABC transporter ATP-binding protein [Patulibacter medicamentivorans]|jgi:putative ABC transport system ATP-binding protein|uniref:ABC transporter ATP-binding protein n=1 Tax=Patulibacter medicamentivorans TaxID=1097667 RepID=UPI00058FAE4F|nr:ABC transporter ATP-binding protein [Patulibacter medicamentivorans]